MTLLKLVALDEEDLEVISTHLQDAVVRVADMVYLPGDKRFVVVVNRFDWEGAGKDGKARKKKYQRRRSGLHFEHVLGAQVQNIRQDAKDIVLELLAIQFEAGETPPAGHITLFFAAGAVVKLDVDCIEVALSDMGPAWQTGCKPEHPIAEADLADTDSAEKETKSAAGSDG